MAGLYSMPGISLFKVSNFKGIDRSVPEDQMKPYRAVNAENIMPGAVGEVRKRPGICFEKALGLKLYDGETVVEMIGGVHPVVYAENGFQNGYKLYYCGSDESYRLVYFGDKMPVAQQYNREWIIFACCLNPDRGQNRGEIGGYSVGAVMAVFGLDYEVTVYGADGYRYKPVGDGWSRERIPHDDPRLTTPEIVKGGKTAGGASPFQQANLMNPWVTESFSAEYEANCTFYLLDPVDTETDPEVTYSTEQLQAAFRAEVLIGREDEDPVMGKVIRYEWAERTIKAGDAFRPAYNRFFLAPDNNKEEFGTVAEGINANGYITKSPKEGEDNVRITHLRAGFEEGFCKICEAVCSAVYGVGGHKDRLFLGGSSVGHPEYKSRVYYSEVEDPFYIGDLNYLQVDNGADVRALDGTGDAMAILTDNGIYFAQASAQDTTAGLYARDALVTVSARIPAPKPIGYGNTAVLGGEIVYLSERGVVAVVYGQKYNERYAEHRSSLIDTPMSEDGPKKILSLGRFLLILCGGGVVWLLDENQPNKEGNRPYAAHQYEGFRLTGMTMDAAWVEQGILRLISGVNRCFWTLGGNEIFKDNYTADVANERAIKAVWETPFFYGTDFKKKKKYKRLGVLLGADEGLDTAVMVEGRKNNEDWSVLWGYDGNLCSFNYANFDYRLFTYSGEPGMPITSKKIKVKKAQRFKLRFTNDFIDQPLTLREFSLDYVQED